MEMLDKNHSRFCAKYVRQVGVAQEFSIGWFRVFKMHDKYYMRATRSYSDYKVGQKILYAKRIKDNKKQFVLHEIIIPEHYLLYQYYYNKENYEPIANINLGIQSYIIEEVSLNTIKKIINNPYRR